MTSTSNLSADFDPDSLDKCLQECLMVNPHPGWLRVTDEQFTAFWEVEYEL